MTDRWYRKTTPGGREVALLVEDPRPGVLSIGLHTSAGELWLSRDELRAIWAVVGAAYGDEIPPAWAVGRIEATDVNGDPIEGSRG